MSSESEGLPLACDMSALEPAERDRHARVTEELMDEVVDTESLDSGYRLWLPADASLLTLAAEFVSRERLCCPFVTFRLTVPSGADRIALDLTGPAGTRELLSEALRID